MQAWRVEKHGGVEALGLVQLATPVPGPMEVLVRVEAVGLNHLDIWVRKGVPGHNFPLPLTPGCDIAGTIAGFGPGAEQGALRRSTCRTQPRDSRGRCEACLGGMDPLCRHYGILGETRDGGCADFVVVPVANVIPRPAN